MVLVSLIALLTLVGCSRVAASCTYPKGTEIPMGTRCVVPFGFFQFQFDGNAVIYDQNSKPLWNTETDSVGHMLVFQADGNLVVYTRNGTAAWSSNTHILHGNALLFEDDRKLVIYNKANKPIWNSPTAYH